MIHYARPARALAASLAFLAGFVDATGFLALGGFFVSFMSGNSTRLGVSLGQGSPEALLAAGLIVAFVIGVIAASLLRRTLHKGRQAAVLCLVAGLLVAAAILHAAGASWACGLVMAMAMGAENGVFERNGEVSIGLTYMTGALVKFGQRLAATLMGARTFAWAPYLMLWASLVAGAFSGAFAFRFIGAHGLWLAATAAAVLSVVSLRLGDPEDA